MRISGLEKAIYIENFEYIAKIFEHEMCCVTCWAKECDIDSFLNLSDSDCTCEDDGFLFEGHVTEVSVSGDISGVSVQLTLIGKTYLLDTDVHYRVFQDQEKTISDILSGMESMSDIKYEGGQEREIGEILIQDGISDWKFVLELADILGMNLFPGKDPFIGLHGKKQIEIKEEECISYTMTHSVKGKHLVCRIPNNLDLGTVIKFKNQELFVYQKRYFLENAQYYYEYAMKEKNVDKKEIVINNDAVLEGIVRSNNDPDCLGRVQLSFANELYEDCMEDRPMWIERSFLYASKQYGEILIPEVNDKVIVRVSNGRGIVLGSLRTEKYSAVVQSVNSKYLVLDDNVYVEYKDSVISVVNKENKVILTGENASVEVGEKTQIALEAGKIYMKIDETEIELSGDIKIKTDSIGLESRNEVSATGTNINLKGKSGVSIN